MEWTDQQTGRVDAQRDDCQRCIFLQERTRQPEECVEFESDLDSPQFRIKNKRGVRERWDIASAKIQLGTLLLIHSAESMSSRLNGPYCWWLKYGFLD